MRVWTIQPVEVYNELMKKGELHVESEKSEFIRDSIFEKANGASWTFKDSYDWLVEQMDKRGISRAGTGENEKGAKEDRYPWWCWYSYNNGKPDLTADGLGETGEEAYCIELNLPDNEVCLTDMDLWHYVLNNSFIHTDLLDESLSDDDWDSLYEKHSEEMIALEHKDPVAYDKLKKESWEIIFNPKYFGKYIQGTFWDLRAVDVVHVEYFVCK